MIDIYDSEALIKIYRLLAKKCDALDKFINNNAVYFSNNTLESSSLDVCNNIIELMERKNKLINLKIIIDGAISSLPLKDKQVVFTKIKYKISMDEFCKLLDLKERTAFRRIEHAYAGLCEALNKSKYLNKLEKIIDEEEWIFNIREEVKGRRLAYKSVETNSL